MNNFNSQVGCQTSRDGDDGVLYQFESVEDVENNLQNLEEPLIPVISGSIFNNITASLFLKHSKTRGLLVLEDDEIEVGSYSPEKACPGNGFNLKENAEEVAPRQCLSKNIWNPDGNWLSYYDFPFGVFIIKSKSQKEVIISKAKANKENSLLKSYPLWGGEVKAFMNSAQNTDTCMRRGTCDPIGGVNINVNIIPKTEDDKRPIILFVTKADATAYFKDLSFGGKDSGASVALLLGVVKALSNVRDNDKNNDFNSILKSDFMVTFLQGESFDYSGSQRLAYQLKNKQYGMKAYNISLDDVKCIIEIGPISISNELYLHSTQPDSDETVKEIQDLFTKYTESTDFQFKTRRGMPPASINSFLREDETKSSVLLTDGDTELLSHVFGSRYDILDNNKALTTKVKNLIKIIGNVALQLAGGKESPQVEVEESLVGEILDCILVNQNCTLLQRLRPKTYQLHDGRLNRYSSVGQRSNYSTSLQLLAQELSKKEFDLTKEKCNATFMSPWVPYLPPYLLDDTCYGIIINRTTAQSPAFKLKEYNSTKYSTWTESRWSPNFQVRLFLMASTSENTTMGCCGLVYFVVMSALIFQCHRRSDQIFPSAS
ncbi:nicastrin-like [Bolinopsis microptera]|uniref:nicastrin-like n=1 Tax=Bolinopsis microptera TaxID=2820187 RepID=UPI00307978E3